MDLQQQLSISKKHVLSGDYSKALAMVDGILTHYPTNIEAYCIKAAVFNFSGKNTQALEVLLQALEHKPDDIMVMHLLCECYKRQKSQQKSTEVANKLVEQIYLLKQAAYADKANLLIIETLAGIYFDHRKLDNAEKCYNIIHELDPNNQVALHRLSFILTCSFDRNGEDRLTRAVKLSNALMDIAQDKLPVSEWTQITALKAIDLELQEKLGDKNKLLKYWSDNMINRAFVYQKSRVETMQDRLDLLEAHRTWGTKLEASTDKTQIKHKVRQRLNSKIRLGISSMDFKSNHIGCYIWPLVDNLDQDRFEIYCYSQWPEVNDPLQKKFEAVADSFKECPLAMNDKDVAQVIADDCLDVLIETGAWFSRSQTIAYRPAPMQISWLDYLHSMGLPTAVDYLVLDPYVKPESPNLMIEKSIILPEVWMVMHPYGFPETPITESLPEEVNGYITFGSMNASYRFTEEIFKVWAGIMKMVPNSRFIYIHPEALTHVMRDNFRKYMEKYGISRDRVSFIATRRNFFEHFNKIDIVLDTFPHMGNTTTDYVLWMGLPLVTLVGPCFFERVSYSALMNCGLGELCAFNLYEYHQIALQLVADKEKRKYIRRNLRSWILNGPLGQAKRFADNMGNAIADVLGRG